MRIGLISDTHGLLRPQAVAFLRGCDHIIHGGDIGDAAILAALRELAPLTAVRGNNDVESWARTLPQTQRLRVGDVSIHVLHDVHELAIDPGASGVDVVVCGHSHRPSIERRAKVLFVNPGSAGPRRFKLPIALGELRIEDANVTARIVELEL